MNTIYDAKVYDNMGKGLASVAIVAWPCYSIHGVYAGLATVAIVAWPCYSIHGVYAGLYNLYMGYRYNY